MQLLDVNVLLALADAAHPQHARANAFFSGVRSTGWATCPLVENGFLRVLSGRAYSRRVASAQVARMILDRMIQAPGHQFWPDDLSLRDARRFPSLPDSRHLTGCYLLSLAVARGGRMATFDRRIDPAWVPGGAQALVVLDPDAC